MARTLLLCSFLTALCFGPPADAWGAAIYRDQATYMAAVGAPAGVATFEDIAPGQAPIVSGGIAFSGPVVVENLLSLPYQTYFGAMGTPIRFALMGFPPGGPPLGIGFQAAFPIDVMSTGFIFQCFLCDPIPNDSLFEWKTFDASGAVIEQGSIVVDLYAGSGIPPVRFLGLVASSPFRSLVMTRRSISQVGAGGWMADDIRYTVAVAPTAAIPTTTRLSLFLTACLLCGSGWIAFRRRTASLRRTT